MLESVLPTFITFPCFFSSSWWSAVSLWRWKIFDDTVVADLLWVQQSYPNPLDNGANTVMEQIMPPQLNFLYTMWKIQIWSISWTAALSFNWPESINNISMLLQLSETSYQCILFEKLREISKKQKRLLTHGLQRRRADTRGRMWLPVHCRTKPRYQPLLRV